MKIRHLLLTLAGLLAFSACNNADEPLDKPETGKGFGSNAIEFTSNIFVSNNRALDASFEAGDKAGIFMLNGSSSTLSVPNAKYTTNDNNNNATFRPADADNKLVLPEDGSNVRFIGYVPYKAGINAFTLPIDVSDQSNPSAIDLIYSNNLKNMDRYTPRADFHLVYEHKLAKIVINLSATTEKSIKVAKASIAKIPTKATFDLLNGLVGEVSTEKEVNFYVSEDGRQFSAIVLPTSLAQTILTIVDTNGVKYEHKFSPLELKKGTKYTYSFKLTSGEGQESGEIELDELGSSITDWNVENDPDVIEVKPVEGEDDPVTPGPEEDFFNLATNKANVPASGQAIAITFTATDGLAWSAVSDAVWATLNQTSGKGSGSIEVGVEENTNTTERVAQITFTAGEIVKVFTITQAAKEEVTPPTPPTPGEEQVIFTEKFSKILNGKAPVEGGVYGKKQLTEEEVASNEYVDNPNFTFKATHKGMVRNTGDLDGHIWIPANTGKFNNTFTISNIPVDGYSDFVLTMDITNNGTQNHKILNIKVNGKTFTGPDRAGVQNTYETVTIPLTGVTPDGSGKMEIEFSGAEKQNEAGIRVDNIILKGKK